MRRNPFMIPMFTCLAVGDVTMVAVNISTHTLWGCLAMIPWSANWVNCMVWSVRNR